MGKKTATTDDTETAEVAAIEAAADDFAPVANVLRGDCRDAMLNVIRNAVDWGKFSEAQQRDVNSAVDYAAGVVVAKAVKAIAAEGREQVTLKLEQLSVKDGIKVTCSGGFTHDALVLLGEAQGKTVLMTVADAQAFDGQRAPAEVIPDQGDLIPEDDSDLVNAADAPTVLRTGDCVDVSGHGVCEVLVNLKTGMIEARPDASGEFNVDVREATPHELAAERDLTADFGADPATETADA